MNPESASFSDDSSSSVVSQAVVNGLLIHSLSTDDLNASMQVDVTVFSTEGAPQADNSISKGFVP